MSPRRHGPCRQAACLLVALLAPGAAVAGPVETQVDRNGKALEIHSTLDAAAPAVTCYATIADLDRLAEFVPGLKSSRIVSPPGAPVELRQVGEAKAGLFGVTLDVTLAVRLDPPRAIEFRRISGNLLQMQGSWNVTGDDRSCRIEYRATMQPDFWVPPLIGPMLMRQKIDEQMAGVLAEIDRRALRTR